MVFHMFQIDKRLMSDFPFKCVICKCLMGAIPANDLIFLPARTQRFYTLAVTLVARSSKNICTRVTAFYFLCLQLSFSFVSAAPRRSFATRRHKSNGNTPGRYVQGFPMRFAVFSFNQKTFTASQCSLSFGYFSMLRFLLEWQRVQLWSLWSLFMILPQVLHSCLIVIFCNQNIRVNQ